jgi:apolipoprotein N-acyltransferase
MRSVAADASTRFSLRRGLGFKARFALAMAAGGLAAIAFPPFGVWPGLFGFGLLMLQIDRFGGPRPLRAAFGLGWGAGFTYFLISTWWVGEAFLVDIAEHGWQAPFAVLILAGGLAFLWGVAAALYRWAAPEGPARVFVFAAAFSLLEWLRGHMLTGFPWDLPGEVWRAGSPPSQGAALLGAYGMSVLTLWIGATAGLLGRRMSRSAMAVAGAALLALAGLWGGGYERLAAAKIADPQALRLRVVQPNIPQTEKWSPEAGRAIVERYLALTASPPAQAGRADPQIVIWPEAALPYLADDFLAPGSWTRAALASALTPGEVLLIGAARSEGSPGAVKYYNSLIALRRAGDGLIPLAMYDKHHLVPFGEYMPFDALASAIGFKTLVHIGDGFTPGPRPVALTLPGLAPFQPLICYEGLFPSSFARTGPRPTWIVNVSNDAWFGETSGPWQHLNLASYRAIEEGEPLVRATPTGVSAVVDAYGRPRAMIGLGKMGVIDADLPPTLRPTPYSRWRDIPFWIFCTAGCAISVLGKARASRRR